MFSFWGPNEFERHVEVCIEGEMVSSWWAVCVDSITVCFFTFATHSLECLLKPQFKQNRLLLLCGINTGLYKLWLSLGVAKVMKQAVCMSILNARTTQTKTHTHPVMDYVSIYDVSFYPRVIRISGMNNDLYQPDVHIVWQNTRIVVQSTVVR